MSRCYGCFSEIMNPGKPCPHCGFEIEKYMMPKWMLRPGTVLNEKYLIGRKIGDGGFGITYLAWDVNMETKVAVKEYYPGYLVSRDVTSPNGNQIMTTASYDDNDFQDGLRKYVKEAAVLSKFFDLPGIVSVKDFFYENETAYIVMEYIDGVSLKKVLEQNGGKVSSDEALRLVKPVISSLGIIHKEKILHRDISPDNIMLDKNGNIKLIDFGAARYFDQDSDKSMTVMLKHGYAPVEQYSRNGDQNTTTDVYSLCAVLYRMITGKVPMESTDRIRNDGLQPVRSLAKRTPKYVAAAIEKGLSVMPEERQQNMEELYEELYISIGGRFSRLIHKVTDKLYSFIRKLLICLIICLSIALAAGVAYWFNKDKIEDFRDKVHQLFVTEETVGSQSALTQKKPEEEPEERSHAKEDKEKKQKESDENKAQENTLREETSQENVATQPAVEQEETQKQPALDSKTEHGIVVVREGHLNGRSQSYTVGNILDLYSDTAGTWDGYMDASGQTYVYYQGSKNGMGFAFEFQTYENDTFRLTGAAQNGEQIETYADFFEQILYEVGV